MANEFIKIDIQPSDLVNRMEERIGGKSLDRFTLKVTEKIARNTRDRIKLNYKSAGIGIKHPSDGLYQSIRHKRIRKSFSEIGYFIGPLTRTKLIRRRFQKDIRAVTYWGAHRHLIEFGHRIVTPSGRDTGRRAKAYPFIGPAFSWAQREIDVQLGPELQKWIDQQPPVTPKG